MGAHDPILDTTIWSPSEKDHATVRVSNEGTLIAASAGGGKTTCVGKTIAYGHLLARPKAGALILTAKAEETSNWISYATACGRDKDLIVFDAKGGHVFDPLYYEFTRPGRGAGDIESIIDLFSTRSEEHTSELQSPCNLVCRL